MSIRNGSDAPPSEELPFDWLEGALEQVVGAAQSAGRVDLLLGWSLPPARGAPLSERDIRAPEWGSMISVVSASEEDGE